MDAACGEQWAQFVRLPHERRVELLHAIQRQQARLAATEALLLNAMDCAPPVVGRIPDRADDTRWVRDEVACALRIAPSTAEARIATAGHLTNALPATLTALREGRICFLQALRLTEATFALDPDVITRVEAAVLPRADQQTVGQFGASIKRAVARYDTRDNAKKHDDAVAGRRVAFTPQQNGMTDLFAELPADAAAAIRELVHRCAAANKGLDERTADQRRADALIDLILRPGQATPGRRRTDNDPSAVLPDDGDAVGDRQATAYADSAMDPDRDPSADNAPSVADDGARGAATPAGSNDDSHGRSGAGASTKGLRPIVQVTVALSTLLGLDECGGDLAGHGAIPAALARALAFDPTGTWRRILTDDDGQFLEAGAHTYRPGAALDRHVRLRDETCRFPGCRRNAGTCELDHVHPWALGGLTTPQNMQALCCKHHHLKDETTWQVSRQPDGSTRWTAPTGHRYQQPPPDPLPLDTTMVVAVEEPAPF